MAYTDQEKDKWLEIAQDTGDSLEIDIPVLRLNEMDKTVSIPGVVFSGIEYDEDGNVTSLGKPQGYAQLPLGTLAIKTRAAQDAADNANAAAARAEEATDEASNVDATLVGMTVTITDRNGDARSVNIGFEILPEHVYPSIAAMNADAANVDAGKFCMIATTDPTSTENAQLWSRNSEPATSEHPFTFLSDLDQAATHAWDDWNTNLRQAIVNATNSANTAATNANNKASAANTAASNANTATTKANTATANANTATANANAAATNATDAKNTVTTWFSGSSNNGFKNQAETWLSTTQATWNNWFSDSLSNGVRKLWNTFWSSINTSWNGFWGTSETDPNGVRKQWADLHSQAESDHNTATSDHTTAQSDHSTAASDHTTAQSDHTASTSAATAANNAAAYANTQGDYSKNMADHPAYIGEDNYWYIWNYAQQKYVKSSYAKGDNLDWESMTEEEKQALADEVLSQIAFDSKPTSGSSNAVTSGGIYTALGNREKIIEASVATSQSIVDELT